MLLVTPFSRKGVVIPGLALLLLLSTGGLCSFAKTQITKEYQIKAVFLFNFAQFVQWPSASFTRADEPFRICVLGDDPFNAFLDETVRGEKVNGHPLVIQRCARVEDAQGCQILYVSRSEAKRMEGILNGLKGKNVLTVGDAEGFVKSGGVVRFVMKGNKVHFRISLAAAKQADLTISSKVLRLAEIVAPGKD